MHGILTGFYMTAVLNVISWNKAYAVFPKDTFIGRKTYMLQPLDAYFEKLLHKYNHRGWQPEEILWSEDDQHTTSIKPTRRLGGNVTWVVPLSIDGVQKPSQPDFVLEHTSFTMHAISRHEHQEPGYPSSTSYQISAVTFEHVALKHRYVVEEHLQAENSDQMPWICFLAHRLHRHGMLQLMATKPQDRPAWFTEAQDHNMTLMFNRLMTQDDGTAIRNFKRPEHWRHIDENIPTWYKQGRVDYQLADTIFNQLESMCPLDP